MFSEKVDLLGAFVLGFVFDTFSLKLPFVTAARLAVAYDDELKIMVLLACLFV
jgi:hypothetical protein